MSSSMVEPTDVGPIAGGHLRTSDADRAQVADVLDAAYAEGRLTRPEHAQRLAAALSSRTFDELVQLTADLVPAPPTAGIVARTAPERLSAVLATTKRVGPWRVAPATTNLVLMGEAVLDLTEATFESRTIEVTCSQWLGSTKIRVPLGTTVRMDVTNVMAKTSVKGTEQPDPRMPTVVVTGLNVLGEIHVRGPRKPLPWKRHVA